MAKTARMAKSKAEFLRLQRKQLDARLNPARQLSTIPPKGGWIRAIRSGLGMSAAQLGRRLGMTRQGVTDLEAGEAAQTISMATLRKVAQALGCEVVIALVPRDSLETIVRNQARQKALDERNRLVHSMRLEQQESGIGDVLDIDAGIDAWLTKRLTKLWD